MDPHVRWLRGRIARAVAILIACWLVVASALSFGVLLSSGGQQGRKRTDQ